MKSERRPMDRSLKRKVVAGTVVALAVGGTGGAIAATQLRSSPSEESKAVVSDAAKQLGVQPDQLSSALKKALENQVDAAVSAGRITKSDETKILNDADQRIANLVNGKIIRPARPEGWFGHRDDFGARPGTGYQGPPAA